MHPATLYTAGAYAAGLALTLCLCAWLTPRHWWRRPTARTLGIGAAGTWGLGSLILAAVPAAPPVLAAPMTATEAAPMTAPMTVPMAERAAGATPGQPFHVHRDLNLRAGAGVDAARLLTVPAGATVTTTGRRHGDWWQVTTTGDGQERTGWASSLWLRRGAAPPAARDPAQPRELPPQRVSQAAR